MAAATIGYSTRMTIGVNSHCIARSVDQLGRSVDASPVRGTRRDAYRSQSVASMAAAGPTRTRFQAGRKRKISAPVEPFGFSSPTQTAQLELTRVASSQATPWRRKREYAARAPIITGTKFH